jgi:pimeloyl-ACP methyl ester carboxylesterase
MTLFVLPGMGAGSTMYGGPWRDLDDTLFLDWPEYRNEKTVAELADRLILEHGITSNDLVLGTSMGGMAALEIASRLNHERVILIDSATSRREINPLLTMLAPLAKITPLRLSQVIAGLASGELGKMFMKSNPDFIRAMCMAVSQWQEVDFPEDRIVRIHGSRDHVIHCPDQCYEIKGAGHLAAMTHAKECVTAVRDSK